METGSIKIVAPHHPLPGHFFEVREEMRSRGAPRIRCYERERNFYVALEGSHRLAAARFHGLVPELQVMALHDTLEDHDFWQLRRLVEVWEILDYLRDGGGPVYEFERC